MRSASRPMPEDVGRQESAWATFVRGLRLSPELKVGLAGTVVLALVATAGRAIVPIAVKYVIDTGLGGGEGPVDLPAIVQVLAFAAVAIVITALASGAMNARLASVVETALSSLRVRAFRHIHDLSMLHQATHQRGQLVARVTTDVDEISRFMSWGGINLLTSLGQLTVATLVMLVYSWKLTLVVLVTFLPFVLAARWYQRRMTVAYMTVRQRVGAMLGVVAETVVGAPVVRAYGIERRTQSRLDERIEDHRAAAIHAGVLSSTFSGTGEMFAAVATAVTVVVGVWLGIAGDVTAGTVVAFLFLITLFVEPVQVAMEVVNEGQTAIAGWRRVLDILDIPPDVSDPGEDGRAIPSGPIGIRFQHVEFRYPTAGETASEASGPVVLHDIDLSIEPQTRVAIVGETGSGKTTFAKLLTRLMDPTGGMVLVNGTPLDQVRFDSLRSRIVMVPQDGSLFEGTIDANVRMGLDARGGTGGTTPEERIELANELIELAFIELGLADWIDELPEGLGTQVGERGNALSAGERQLVALARAYIANPDLLVLDEATSAVDPATEVRLQRALVGLTRGRTTVSIAHRMSTAEAADEVLVFDAGRVVERGTHGELVDAGGVYSRLHESWRTGQAA